MNLIKRYLANAMSRGVQPSEGNEVKTATIGKNELVASNDHNLQELQPDDLETPRQSAMARGVPPKEIEHVLSVQNLPEQVRPSPQAADQLPPVKKLVFLAEKTYTGIEPQAIPPLEMSLTNMSRQRNWS